MESSSTKLNCFWGIPQKSAYVIYIITKKNATVNCRLLIGHRIFLSVFVYFVQTNAKVPERVGYDAVHVQRCLQKNLSFLREIWYNKMLYFLHHRGKTV